MYFLSISLTSSFSQGGTALAKSLSATKKLRYLDLGDNNFDEEGSAILAAALTDQPDLIHLNLSSTGLGDDGTKTIVESLGKTAESLEVLNLAGNEIKKAAKQLADFLKIKDSLVQIRLEENELGNRGAKAIAEALHEGHEKLEEVDLSMNEIEDEGALAIVKSLKDKKNLKSIVLKDNDISEEAQEEARAILDEVGKGHCLRFEEEEEEVKPTNKQGIDQLTEQLNAITINK